MKQQNHMPIDALSALITGRTGDLFIPDVESRHDQLIQRVESSRILVIGGAGSIGSATVRALCRLRPYALHVVDQNENNLAELVRDLRSSLPSLEIEDFRAFPLDYGSPVMYRFIQETLPYDIVLNFAAVKHVRSEKDIYSLLHMLDTNIVKVTRFLRWLSEKETRCRYFCVSTDKAANPVGLMGATKRIMEHIVFSSEILFNSTAHVTSARFANVCFSDGSLLDSFLRRLQKRQPLAVPSETRRFFITLREASEICILAAVCAPHRHTLVPRMDPVKDLRDLESVARVILDYYGLKPRIYQSEIESKMNLQSDVEQGFYPLLLTKLDTSGEKPYEEFVGQGEKLVDLGVSSMQAVEYLPTDIETLSAFLRKIEDLVTRTDRKTRKEEVVECMSTVIPQLRHIETGKNLDNRM